MSYYIGVKSLGASYFCYLQALKEQLRSQKKIEVRNYTNEYWWQFVEQNPIYWLLLLEENYWTCSTDRPQDLV